MCSLTSFNSITSFKSPGALEKAIDGEGSISEIKCMRQVVAGTTEQ